MSNFDEFDRPIGPEKDTGSIISHAFENYKNIIGYAILFVIISFLISTGISLLFPGINIGLDTYKEIIEAAKSGDSESIKDIVAEYQDCLLYTSRCV